MSKQYPSYLLPEQVKILEVVEEVMHGGFTIIGEPTPNKLANLPTELITSLITYMDDTYNLSDVMLAFKRYDMWKEYGFPDQVKLYMDGCTDEEFYRKIGLVNVLGDIMRTYPTITERLLWTNEMPPVGALRELAYVVYTRERGDLAWYGVAQPQDQFDRLRQFVDENKDTLNEILADQAATRMFFDRNVGGWTVYHLCEPYFYQSARSRGLAHRLFHYRWIVLQEEMTGNRIIISDQ
jgi:hypothetical protein